MANAEEPTDQAFEDALRAVPGAHWDDLWDAVAAVRGEPGHMTWGGGEQVVRTVNGVEQPATTMPYAVYSPAVDRLRSLLGALVVPFAWPDWDGVLRYRGGAGMAAAPVADAVRMIVAVLRSERFSEGSIGGALSDGTLLAAVDRVRRWYDEHRETTPT